MKVFNWLQLSSIKFCLQSIQFAILQTNLFSIQWSDQKVSPPTTAAVSRRSFFLRFFSWVQFMPTDWLTVQFTLATFPDFGTTAVLLLLLFLLLLCRTVLGMCAIERVAGVAIETHCPSLKVTWATTTTTIISCLLTYFPILNVIHDEKFFLQTKKQKERRCRFWRAKRSCVWWMLKRKLKNFLPKKQCGWVGWLVDEWVNESKTVSQASTKKRNKNRCVAKQSGKIFLLSSQTFFCGGEDAENSTHAWLMRQIKWATGTRYKSKQKKTKNGKRMEIKKLEVMKKKKKTTIEVRKEWRIEWTQNCKSDLKRGQTREKKKKFIKTISAE